MNTIGINNNLDRARIRKLLVIGLFSSVMTGAGDFLLGFGEEIRGDSIASIIPPEKGYDFSYHNLVCPLSDFAKTYGYEEYMPYLCNLDYVMFGVFGVPLYRERSKWTQSLWNTGRRSLHRARDTNKEKVLQCQDMTR